MRHLLLACAFVAAAVAGPAARRQPPASLPAWSPGTLDIHHIATGRGNATFFVFPDGTTMLVDAGAVVSAPPYADPRPDGSRTPGAWIADYVRQFHPSPARPRLDYVVVTHFHPDHFGEVAPSNRTTADGLRLTGVTEVLDLLGARVVVDRAWPTYDYPSNLLGRDTAGARVEPNAVANYKAYVERQAARGALAVERVKVGSASQFAVAADPRGPGVEVRPVVANGEVWTGRGEGTEQTFPPLASIPAEDYPDENMCSIGLRVRYGRFDYFTGGDLPGDPEGAPPWQGVEAKVGAVLGPTDVHQVNHHGSIDPATPGFLAALRSRVLIVPAWAPTHPSPDVLKRLLNRRYYPDARSVFTLTLREPMTHAIGARVGQLASSHGHVVVRVAPGGEAYSVFVLDDASAARPVTAAFGPYTAR
ncbi:MAG: MBL fold metallo-hydrolase [Vicinamibacterales bacterium]